VINVGWGVSIDGNDDVWVANFWGRGVVLMAGAEPKGHPAGTKAGDVVHQFTGGTIQMLTDVVIDLAGNVWAANNWNSPGSSARRSPALSYLDLGRRVGFHGYLWHRGPSETAANGPDARLLRFAPARPRRMSWKHPLSPPLSRQSIRR
jgi:hypothetical protein